MSWILAFCNLLISLPDISKWNINNITDMREMFDNCSSLIYLSNLKKYIIPSA